MYSTRLTRLLIHYGGKSVLIAPKKVIMTREAVKVQLDGARYHRNWARWTYDDYWWKLTDGINHYTKLTVNIVQFGIGEPRVELFISTGCNVQSSSYDFCNESIVYDTCYQIIGQTDEGYYLCLDRDYNRCYLNDPSGIVDELLEKINCNIQR